jgi:hypothetical protein
MVTWNTTSTTFDSQSNFFIILNPRIKENNVEPLVLAKREVLKERKNEFIIRVYALIKTPGLLDLYKDGELFLKAPETSHHLCVFENIVSGIKFEEEARLQKMQDFLKSGFLKKWVLVDVDGVIKGNPFLRD